MNILFVYNKFRKECCKTKLLKQRWGEQAEPIRQRLDEFRDAETLEDIATIPAANCHELSGKSKGCLSVNLKFPYRLKFEPADNPIPKKPDGGLDWSQIRTVRILRVENTHEIRRKSE